jgi:hypothetical protein
MMERFPLQRHGFVGRSYPTPRRLCGRGWERPPSKGFSIINKLLDKIIYFYYLSVNYNNCLPDIGNDNQNDIDCCWWAAIIYELN